MTCLKRTHSPASQIDCHIQVNPSVHEGSLLMPCTATGNSVTLEANGEMMAGGVFAALYKNYAFSCYLDWILLCSASMLVW